MRLFCFILMFFSLIENSRAQVLFFDAEEYADCFEELLRLQNSQILARKELYLPKTIPYQPNYLPIQKSIRPIGKQEYSLCPNFYDYLTRLEPHLQFHLSIPQLSENRLARERKQDTLSFINIFGGPAIVQILGRDSSGFGLSLKKGIRALYVGGKDYIGKVPLEFQEHALFTYNCNGLLRGPEVFYKTTIRLSKNEGFTSYISLYLFAFVQKRNENTVSCLDYIDKLEHDKEFGKRHGILKMIFKIDEVDNRVEYIGQIFISGEVLSYFDNMGRPFHQIFKF